MATLKRRSVYKGGGASYELEGVRGMVYISPGMFTGEKVDHGDGRLSNAPDSIELNVPNLATPDNKATERAQAKEEAKAKRNAEKEQRQSQRVEARQAREQAREQKKLDREQARDQKRQERDERRAAAKSTDEAPVGSQEVTA